MTKFTRKDILKVFVFLLIMGAFSVITQKPWQTFASVVVGNTYDSTTTPIAADGKLLCPGRGTLGSIILTGPKYGGQFQILDATTTDVVNGNSARAATTSLILADVPATVLGNATTTSAMRTYDSRAKNGIIIAAYNNSMPTTTITYRCNE